MNLLMSSDSHENALENVLSGVSVASNTTSEELDATIRKMIEANKVSFRKDEIPSEGVDHNKALHITVKCGDQVISRVLVDGGSRVNICPFFTLRELGINMGETTESHVRVRAFDGSQKGVIGEIYMALKVRPVEFPMLFQVMGISSSYNLLLGRSCIHIEGAVRSTLHQCMKFE